MHINFLLHWILLSCKEKGLNIGVSVSLLFFFSACRHPPATAQIITESMLPNVVEGENTLLLVCDIPENLRHFFWDKGLIIVNRNETVQNVIATNNNILGAHSVNRSQDISQLFRLA